MGFRSTITSQHYDHPIPEWFKEKYKEYLLFPSGSFITSSKEFKLYSGMELFSDYQKCLIENGLLKGNFEVVCAVLAEDGGVTRVILSKDRIEYFITEDRFQWDGLWNQ
jgi:hypothetical protein